MTLHIKNWTKFQHFKDRRPPWVKLYRDLLDDMEWHQLEPRAAKALVMLWLIASEYDGQLPEAKTIAFRLRTSVAEVEEILASLSHWLGQGDIPAISGGAQDDPPEREESRDKERDRRAREFEAFYAAYPKKKSPADAEKAFAKVTAPVADLLAAIERQRKSEEWCKDGGRYIPYPATWLNQQQWLNQEAVAVDAITPPRHHDSAEATQRLLADMNKGTKGMPAEVRQFAAQVIGKKAA